MKWPWPIQKTLIKFYVLREKELPLNYPYNFQRSSSLGLLLMFKLPQLLPSIGQCGEDTFLESTLKCLKIDVYP